MCLVGVLPLALVGVLLMCLVGVLPLALVAILLLPLALVALVWARLIPRSSRMILCLLRVVGLRTAGLGAGQRGIALPLGPVLVRAVESVGNLAAGLVFGVVRLHIAGMGADNWGFVLCFGAIVVRAADGVGDLVAGFVFGVVRLHIAGIGAGTWGFVPPSFGAIVVRAAEGVGDLAVVPAARFVGGRLVHVVDSGELGAQNSSTRAPNSDRPGRPRNRTSSEIDQPHRRARRRSWPRGLRSHRLSSSPGPPPDHWVNRLFGACGRAWFWPGRVLAPDG